MRSSKGDFNHGSAAELQQQLSGHNYCSGQDLGQHLMLQFPNRLGQPISYAQRGETRETACKLIDILDYPDAAAELERELQLGLSSICFCLGQGLCMGQPLVSGRLGRSARACLGQIAHAFVLHQPQRLERLGTRPELLPAWRAIVLQTTTIDTLRCGICI